MNKNKGFIGLGLIVAIVLGIVVVGGGAYYLGKSKGENKEIVKIEENNSHEVPAGPYGTKADYVAPKPINSEVITASQKCIDTAKSLLPAYISRGELLDIKLNKVEFFASNSDTSGAQYFTGNPTRDACMVSVSYDIKPKPEFYEQRLPANGQKSSGGWIVNKSGYATIDKNSSGYYVVSMGTGY